MRIVHEIAIVVLTDRHGRVLMQHRGPDARVEPGRWTPPGGHLEPGEDALTAAHRELFEETGLTATLTPCRVVDEVGAGGDTVRFHVFAGDTEAGSEDVILGEGSDMRFLTGAQITAKDLVGNAWRLLGHERPRPAG